MATVKLTGLTRYRIKTRWFKAPLLVLQVEEQIVGHVYCDDHGNTDYVNNTGWRDAKLGDITTQVQK